MPYRFWTTDMHAETRIPTTDPKETLGRIIEFIRNTILSRWHEGDTRHFSTDVCRPP